MITYGMTFWNVINALTPHRVSEDMVNLVVLPLFHTGGLNCYANPAVHMGGTNIILRSFDPGECLKLLADPEYGVTHMLAVPTNYLFMSQHPTFEQSDLSKVKTFGIGGAPTPKEMINTYAKRNIGLQQVFGMTETSPLVSALTAENAMLKIGSAGLPVLHNQVKIMTEHGEYVSTPETVGELWVKGPNITPGYWNKPEVNATAFTDGWLHTGDAAYLDAEGFIYIVDRWKDMYISGGENVYPAEIENVIYQLPQVGEVAVIGIPDGRWGEVGQAIIVVKPEQTLDEATVLKHCADKLAKFKQPQSVRFIDEIPHNATGKVLKRELRLQS
jgi:fatty-acyl-CoA synthase